MPLTCHGVKFSPRLVLADLSGDNFRPNLDGCRPALDPLWGTETLWQTFQMPGSQTPQPAREVIYELVEEVQVQDIRGSSLPSAVPSMCCCCCHPLPNKSPVPCAQHSLASKAR